MESPSWLSFYLQLINKVLRFYLGISMNKKDQKQKDMVNFTEEFTKAASRQGAKSLGDAIGLPDDEDKARIQQWLLMYEKKHPGELQFHRDMARNYYESIGGKTGEFAEVNKEAHGRIIFELPVAFGQWLEGAYPLMFKDKKHYRWFVKNFPELMIPRKY